MAISNSPSPLNNIISAKTYNAAWFFGATKEAQITTAIAAAVTDGALYVYVPANMLPYNASLVTFNTAIRMVREGGDFSVFDIVAYGAAGDNATDNTASFTAVLAKITIDNGGILFVPKGQFKTGQIVLPNGCILRGAFKNSITGLSSTIVSTVTGATSAIIISNGSDITLENFYLYALLLGTANVIDVGGAAGSRRIRVTDVVTNSTTTGAGLALATGAGGGFQFHVNGFTGVGSGWAITTGPSTTSSNFMNCYANSCTLGGYSIGGLALTFSSCAADSNTGYAYDLTGAISTVFNGCDAESNTKGAFRLNTGCVGIVINGCRGVGNNTSATAGIGSFLQIGPTGVSYDNVVTGCVDTAPNATTTQSIRGEASQAQLILVGYNATAFPKGVGGDATFLANYVTYVGGDIAPFKGAYFVGGLQTNQEGNLISGLDTRTGTYYQATMTASRTFAAPTTGTTGQRIVITIIQNGTGGWTVTWNAAFKVSWSDAGNTLNKRSTVAFYYDGTNWNQDGAQSPYV